MADFSTFFPQREREKSAYRDCYSAGGILIHSASNHRCTPFYLMFGQEMRTKLSDLRRETVEVRREDVRDRDWRNKLKGKAYADAHRGATPKSIRIGDTVLLKVEKSNKLSTNFRPSPFKLVQKTETEVTVRNEAGEEFRRNTVFVKKYNQQDSVEHLKCDCQSVLIKRSRKRSSFSLIFVCRKGGNVVS